MGLPETIISFTGSTFLFAILALVGIALSIFFYRQTLPPIQPGRRALLAALRSLVLVVLLFLLFEPLLKFLFHRDEQPIVAVLIDDSQSMAIADRIGNRSRRLRDFLASDPLQSISSGTRISFFRFSSKLFPLSSSDSLRFQAEVTDIAASLAQLDDLRKHKNIQAAVLISDGNTTIGKNPISIADELGIPLYTVGVGDTTEQKDLLISKVATNNVVYAETEVPVNIRVQSFGFKKERVEIALSQGTKVVSRTMLELKEGIRDYTVTLRYKPSDEGVHRYTVSVSSLAGELTTKNNISSFFVKVLKSRLQLLIIAGAPSPDVSIVRQILTEDPHFSVRALVQRNSNSFYELAFRRAILDSADCLVLIGYPSAASSLDHVQLLRSLIEDRKKPILFINAKALDLGKAQPLESILPFSWTSSSPGELLAFPSVPEKQRMNTLIDLEGVVDADGWNQLPPIFKTLSTFRAKPEADVLAFAKIQSVVLNEPLVAIRNIAHNKAFAITGYGIWRWRLLAQGNPRTESFLSLLLGNAVRWLTTIDEGKNIRVSPTKETFTTAEPVEFTGEVYDEQYRPVDDAELRVEVSSGGERFETLLRSIGSGRYEGALEGLGTGQYGYVAKAARSSTVVGEDHGKFSVGDMNVEFLQTRMNKPLLEQLAFRTGGAYMDLDMAHSITDSIRTHTPLRTMEITQTAEIELWNWQYLAALVVLLLAVEWIIRKGSGML